MLQALSNDDRRLWLEVLGGKEPVSFDFPHIQFLNLNFEVSLLRTVQCGSLSCLVN